MRSRHETDGYQLLANELVKQSYREYRNLRVRQLKAKSDSLAERLTYEIDQLLEFFYSDWYAILTDVDPDYVLDRIDREVEKKYGSIAS